MVPGAGLEPARGIASRDFKCLASEAQEGIPGQRGFYRGFTIED